MGLVIVTPPTELPVSLDEVKGALNMRAERLDQDEFLYTTIRAVTDWLAGRNGWLGMSLCEQTLELTVEDLFERRWPCDIRLPRPPLIEVVSVSQVNDLDIAAVMPTTDYRVGTGSDGIGYVRFTLGSFPGGWGEAVRIRYRAGRPEAELDEGLRRAIVMTVTRLYENRGDGVATDFRDDPFVQELFAPYRVWGP
jgi:uncharacterized phiE125 gp8 family phage protein